MRQYFAMAKPQNQPRFEQNFPTRLPQQTRGRGAGYNPAARFERHHGQYVDDGWESLAELPRLLTTVTLETPRQIITTNQSPDVGFDRSINPYRGCEHGCIYCYARPSHAHMGLSPGLDFESKLFAKPEAAERLRAELSAPGYRPRTIMIGVNTDAYQPIERRYRITRSLLEVMLDFRHPVGLITKSALITRDIDILKQLAAQGLVKVAVSLTTLDPRLARAMEPRAATPTRRLDAIRQLAEAGIPVTVMMAPIVPGLTDHEIEKLLAAAAGAGAREAGYVLMRLPHEVKDLFKDWLAKEKPDRAARVMALVRDTRGGRDNDPEFGSRMVGSGPYAWQLGRRFQMTCERLGLNRSKLQLNDGLFQRPPRPGDQLTLW
jgi:DNA repair photolyase